MASQSTGFLKKSVFAHLGTRCLWEKLSVLGFLKVF